MFRFSFLFLIAACPFASFALEFPMSARQTALGMSGTALVDPFSSFLNPANNALLTGPFLGLNAQNISGMKELNALCFTLGLSTKSSGAFSFSGSQSGTLEFREQVLQLGYAKKLSPKFFAGIQIVSLALLLQDEKIENNYLWTMRAGFLFMPLNKLRFGFSVFNPNRTRWSMASEERIPVVVRIGSEYSVSKKISWYMDVEKRSAQDLRLGSGLEYRTSGHLSMRTGFNTHPFRYTYGFGLRIKKIQINTAAIYQTVLGYTTAISILYEINGE